MSVKRFDNGTLRKPKKLASGFLRVDALLTRTGIFEYRTPAGGIRRELRLPEEVFRADALESFEQLPVTDDHPPEMLTDENAREYQRGNLGETVRRDGEFVRAPMLITDAALRRKMEAGKHQVSCGYTCDVDETPGTWNGQRYDAIQRNIRGNHVAIVAVGRAGAECAVRMDSGDAFGGAVIQESGMEEKIKELETEIAKQTARADAAEAELAKERAARKDAADAVPALVKARVALVRQAGEVLGPDVKLDDMTDLAIKAAVVEKVDGEKLDEKLGDVYIGARYDGALKHLAAARTDGVDDLRRATEQAKRTDAAPAVDPAAKARKAWGEAWKAPIPGGATKETGK